MPRSNDDQPSPWRRSRANFADYGADEIIDIATVLEDPANPAWIAPAYLYEEDGDVYEATRFPPGAQL